MTRFLHGIGTASPAQATERSPPGRAGARVGLPPVYAGGSTKLHAGTWSLVHPPPPPRPPPSIRGGFSLSQRPRHGGAPQPGRTPTNHAARPLGGLRRVQLPGTANSPTLQSSSTSSLPLLPSHDSHTLSRLEKGHASARAIAPNPHPVDTSPLPLPPSRRSLHAGGPSAAHGHPTPTRGVGPSLAGPDGLGLICQSVQMRDNVTDLPGQMCALSPPRPAPIHPRPPPHARQEPKTKDFSPHSKARTQLEPHNPLNVAPQTSPGPFHETSCTMQ